MPTKRKVSEKGIPRILDDMRRAYGNPVNRNDAEQVVEFREMRRSDPKGFHLLLQRYEDQWAQTKELEAAKAKVDDAPLEPCEVLVNRMLDEWDKVK